MKPRHVTSIAVLSLFLFAWPTAFAGPGVTTYQARIIKPNGDPLEAANVNFRFTILDPSGTCILYSENFSGVNMLSSAGLVSFSLGAGIKTYPASSTTFANVFSNITPSLSCDAGGPANYSPTASDMRKIVMQFHDGSGWQTLPAMAINAVPYAMYSNEALKLSGYEASDFVRVTTVPTCGASEALRYNGANFSCVAVGGGSATVTSGSVVTALGYEPVAAVSAAIVSALGFTPANSVTVTNLSSTLAASFAAITSSQWNTSGTTINYMAGNVGIGTVTPQATLDVSGAIRVGASAAVCNSSNEGSQRFNATTKMIEYCNGTAWSAFGVSGSGLQSFNGSASSTQSLSIGAGGIAPAFSTANGVHTLNIPLASAGSVTAGLISNADYVNFANKLNATSAAVVSILGYTPANSSTLGTLAALNFLDLNSPQASGTLAAARLPAFGGDLTSVSGSANLTLVNSGVTSGTYSKVSVNAKGLVTAGAQLTASEVTTALGYTPSSEIKDLVDAHTTETSIYIGSGTVQTDIDRNNTALGISALHDLTTGSENVAMGTEALYKNTTGFANTAVGWIAMYDNTTGGNNTAIGNETLSRNVEGFENTAVGSYALNRNTGGNNTALGSSALSRNTNGEMNIGVGTAAGINNVSGSANVFVGTYAGYGAYSASNVSGSTIIGYQAGYAIRTGGDFNILLGYKAGDAITTGSRNIVIGNDIDISPTVSQTLNIGNYIYGTNLNGTSTDISSATIGLGVLNPSARLHLQAGTTTVPAFKFTSGTLLTSPQSGTIEYNGFDYYFTDGTSTRRSLSSIAGAGVTSSSITSALGYTPANDTTVTNLSSTVATSFTTLTNNINSVSSSISSLATSTAASFAAITPSQWNTSGTTINYMAGNVGIGTTAPAAKLDVSGGAVRFRGKTYISTESGGIDTIDAGNSTSKVISKSGNLSSGNLEIWSSGSGIDFKNPWGLNSMFIATGNASNAGNVGIGTSAPTARLHLAAGSATQAAFKLTSGTLLASPASGAVEYDGTNLYFTDEANTRRTLATITNSTGDFKADGSVSMTGQFKAVSGSLAAPGIMFANDPDTGFATTAPNTMFFVTGGLGTWLVTSTSLGTNAAGPTLRTANTQASPSIGWTFDGDTGFFNPSANLIAITTSGTEKMRIDSTGNVGIGTSSPVATLDVSGTLKFAGSTTPVSGGVLTSDASGNATWRAPSSSGSTQWTTSGSDIYYASGSVRVGTSSSSTTYTGLPAFLSASPIILDGVTRTRMSLLTNGFDISYCVSADCTSLGTLLKATDSGVATAQKAGFSLHNSFYPSADLQVSDQSTGDGGNILVSNQTVGISATDGLEILMTTAGNAEFKNQEDGYMSFATSSTEKVRIASNGNVGIGTVLPTATFEVSGTLKFAGSTTPVSGGVLTSDASGTATWKNLASLVSFGDFKADGSVSMTGQFRAYDGNSSAPDISFVADTDTGIMYGGANNMLFVAGGATTWYLSSTTFGANSVGPTFRTNNTQSSPSIGWSADADTGFYNPLANTIGITTSGAERLRIDSAGNVGIGTSAPAHRLDVTGGSMANDTSIYFTQLNSGSFKFNAVQLDPYVSTATSGSETTGLSIGTKTGGTTTWSVDFADNIYTYVPINANASTTFLNRSVSSTAAHSLAFYKRRPSGGGSVLANDNLAWIPGYGHTGSAWASTYSAAIGMRATENISSSAAGGQLWFETTPNGTTTPQNRMVIDQNGYVGIGTSNPTTALEIVGIGTFKKTTTGGGFDPTIISKAPNGQISLGSHGSVNKIVPSNLAGTAAQTLYLEGPVGDSIPQIYLRTEDLKVTGTSPVFNIGSSQIRSSGSSYLLGGNVGIGTTSPSYTLDVTGTMRVTGQAYTNTGNGSFSILSDIRYKDVHGSYDRGLAEILNIDVIKFNYKKDNPLGSDSSREYVGISAQNLQQTIPEAVEVRKDKGSEYLTINTSPVLWTLINAVKQLYMRLLGVEGNMNRQIALIAESKADKVEIEGLRDKAIKLEYENAALKTYLCSKDPAAPICK